MKLKKFDEINLREIDRAITFAQAFTGKMVYSIKNDAKPQAGSLPTAYHRLQVLEQIGMARYNRDVFAIDPNVVNQPLSIRKKLLDSLIALKNARRFGKYYTESDVNFAKKHLPGKFLTTLDYAAWELTRYQSPYNFFIYVNDVDESAKFLTDNGFSEGKNGNVILLPKMGDFQNVIERIYHDCIAKGGRSTLDGIAIGLLYGNNIRVRGYFTLGAVKKVQEDLPRLSLV